MNSIPFAVASPHFAQQLYDHLGHFLIERILKLETHLPETTDQLAKVRSFNPNISVSTQSLLFGEKMTARQNKLIPMKEQILDSKPTTRFSYNMSSKKPTSDHKKHFAISKWSLVSIKLINCRPNQITKS